MIAAALFGAFALFVSATYESMNVGPRNLLDLLRDVGTAVLVAVFTAVTIEVFVNARVRAHIAHDVFQATFRKFLPDVLYEQVRDSVLQAGVIRREWEVYLRVLDPEVHRDLYAEARGLAGSDVYLVEYTVSYYLENLSTIEAEYTVEGGIDLDLPLPTLGIPRFTSVLIGDDAEDKDRAKAVPISDAVAVLTVECKLDRDGLQIWEDSGELIFHEVRKIPPRRERSGNPDDRAQLPVHFELRRALRVPGMIVLSASAPSDGIKIRIDTVQDIIFDVTAQHPDKQALEKRGNEWLFKKRGILPWQGFIIRASTPTSRRAATPLGASGSDVRITG